MGVNATRQKTRNYFENSVFFLDKVTYCSPHRLLENLLIFSMAISRKKRVNSNKDVYEKAEDLPEAKKKMYVSILEDFDKQVVARIEQIHSAINALQTQVKSQFRMNLLKEPRNIRQMKVEDLYYNEEDDDQAITDKLNLTVECAKVAMSVDKLVSNEVKTNVKSKGKAKATKKKSSILSQGPGFANTGVRRSTRKRTNPSSFLISSTPLASSTLTAAALGCTTAKTSRTKGRLVDQTPASSGIGKMNGLSMRTAKADEKFLVSMQGSPVYVPKAGKSKQKDNMIPVPLGNGKTLMVPTDNPDVQPILQNLIKSCMRIMDQK